jgi:hypothetical protein
MQSIGFKEWAVVCEALERGRQSILVRKGGIAEGREGFSFKHREFFLFPTWFHEQPEKVRVGDIRMPAETAGIIEIRCWVKVEIARVITSWSVAEALEPLHVLRPEVVRERFDYEEVPGIHVAFVRAYRVTPAWSLPTEKRFGGCRSWVDLPPAQSTGFKASLTDTEHGQRQKEFFAALGEEQVPLEHK